MNPDFRSLAYAGWDKTAQTSAVYQYYFSAENIAYLSALITELLKSTGQTIRVADRVIAGVMSNVAANFNPKTGDIYSRYVIPDKEPRDDLKNMNQQVVTVVVNTVREELDQQRFNSKLSVWNSVLGSFNAGGLRAHPVLKTKERDYMKGMFSMNY